MELALAIGTISALVLLYHGVDLWEKRKLAKYLNRYKH